MKTYFPTALTRPLSTSLFASFRFWLIATVLLLLVLDIRFVQFKSSPAMIRFIHAVTITSPTPIMKPPTNSSTSTPASGGGSETDGSLIADPYLMTPTPVEDFALRRYAAKLHIVNPVQLFTDYPIARFLCVELGMIELEWLSPNLISCIHPAFAIFAGYLVFKSAKGGNIGGSPSAGAPSAINNCDSPTNGVSPSNNAVEMSETGGSGVQTKVHARSASGMGTPNATTTVEISKKVDDPIPIMSPTTMDRSYSSLENNNNASMTDADKETAALLSGASTRQSVQLKLLRAATVVMMLRNTLDTIDGIVARLRKQQTGSYGPKLFGLFTGDVVDPMMDIGGVSCFALGCAMFLFTKSAMIHRIPSNFLSRLGFQIHLKRPLLCARLTVGFGLFYLMAATSFWEGMMLKLTALLDGYGNTNPAIFELAENNFHVRMCEFLLSITYGDMAFSVILFCMFFNRLWEAVQFYMFVGYPWLVMVAAYCTWVWQSVILANPTAAMIVAQNPGKF